MLEKTILPAGQREIERLPRFGMPQFANRFPREIYAISIEVGGDVEASILRSADLTELERMEQISDFHCVTTWTKRNVRWSGYRFADIYNHLLGIKSGDAAEYNFAIFRGQDGYRVGLPLEDLLAPNVLLADMLEGEALPVAHGAPIRLIAPAHYGYKSIKHVSRIEFWRHERVYRRGAFKFMDHPRARVAQEERGRYFPGWFLRVIYRPLIQSTIRKFSLALAKYSKDCKAL